MIICLFLICYSSHATRATQWEHPTTAKKKVVKGGMKKFFVQEFYWSSCLVNHWSWIHFWSSQFCMKLSKDTILQCSWWYVKLRCKNIVLGPMKCWNKCMYNRYVLVSTTDACPWLLWNMYLRHNVSWYIFIWFPSRIALL